MEDGAGVKMTVSAVAGEGPEGGLRGTDTYINPLGRMSSCK